MIKNFIIIFTLLIITAITACAASNPASSSPKYYQENLHQNTSLSLKYFSVSEALDSFYAVLINEQTFYHPPSGMIYFDDFLYEYTDNDISFFREVFDFTILDINGDGIPEIIISMAHTQLIYLVLHYYDGKVFGHDFAFRLMNNIKTDGTFNNSFGATLGVARLDFAQGFYVYEFVFNSQYQVDFEAQDAKENAKWYQFDSNYLQDAFANWMPH